jgi:hypothetical protein
VDAQNEYAEKDRTGEGVGVYAQRIVSSPGKKDGLFWRDDREPSPLGELAAQASTEGYKLGEQAAPYHGYYYRILKGQGSNAPGGALNYVVKDKMIGGFALIAYPAEYGNSGVMTFMVNHAGTVYQKDLGPRTDSIAKRVLLVRSGSDLEEGRCGGPLNAGKLKRCHRWFGSQRSRFSPLFFRRHRRSRRRPATSGSSW